jgi:hypothetical protein
VKPIDIPVPWKSQIMSDLEKIVTSEGGGVEDHEIGRSGQFRLV